jgi:F-type H+-transporting ATPase subunit b
MHGVLEQLEINQTFFYQFILFAVFFFVISGLYLRPFQRLLEKRNQRLKGDIQSSAELLKSVEQKMAEYEKALMSARQEAGSNYEAALSEIRAKEEAVMAQVKEEIKKDYLKTATQLQEEKLKIESELKLQAGQLSDLVVQKVLSGN